ncbi:MAG TPA: biotin--[acetyl-CoA-carboxylase] ligase [Porphyromonadaceae bacterium]|jgi:BirA family biotin operon repressor/biotin-[acetyl-CoA-carboxylase] ligase|uniref:biotin--[acetyl-CoA-carboxylase] ligase n=1 Tax=Limibacterium fermenti TaxID=3229863 RepID=UPI000E86B0B2|nr:biotin--[acetyl-CoA-carboxylase] ligase [Porphyromonadaceae bacterium]HBK32841.1 biotin--[acetyl-CoA-carboxylase] ligase [Porphyromonadaceae bacterium]HBL32821.1 biotin--[acetyl-CoA-carboxylase] ligase [Porphyromonadaceae bacterium]HBX20599.1 biotin--[acetyl-CoA-carboxylase] ligase [Porphyromonadaceae bacterium]HBX44705.1 biotin--[acetyl-CoA-carboxylase] ligase [Porphyromonadaceae bacterium]
MGRQNEKVVKIRLEETMSTNTYLRLLAERRALADGSLVVAEYQTKGRGQIGNSWFSSKGKNLLFSVFVRPKGIPANEQFLLSRIVSLALKETLDKFAAPIRIKWPNDIYWEEKKIAGILIENDLQGNEIESSIIGIGLNVNEPAFPQGLPNPISLKQITGMEYDRDFILDTFMNHFFAYYHPLDETEISLIEQDYLQSLYHLGEFHRFEDAGGRFMGKIKNVLPSGHLVVETYTREERIYAFKEIAFIENSMIQ